MKSILVIKAILPFLGSLRDGGIFSNPAAVLAESWSNQLATAGIEDGIDLSDVLLQLEALSKATDFETQQDEMATCDAMLNQLLDDIPAGKLPVFIAPPEGISSVRLRLAGSINSAMDTFRPASALMEKMRKDAALLATLAQGEADIANDASVVHDLVDRSIEAPYNQRLQLLGQARNAMARIAA